MNEVTRAIARSACLGGLLVSGGVFAQAGIAINPSMATVGALGGATTPGTFNVVFTQATPATITAYQTDISFNNAQLTIVPTLPGGAADATSCQIVGGNILRLTDFTVAGTLPSGNACAFTLTVATPQLLGTAYSLNVNATQCSDAASMPISCAETDLVIFVIDGGPRAPVVAPLAATTLSAGPIASTATGNVAVNVTSPGSVPGSLALSCAIVPGANAFAITGGGTQTIAAPAAVGPGTPIGVSCTRGAADATATLTCTQTATPGPNPANLTATVACPAGIQAPNPASVPLAPGPVSLVGAPGGAATGGVTFTNMNGSLAYAVNTCTVGTGITVTTALPLTVPVNGQAALAATCTAPVTPGATVSTLAGLACATSVPTFSPSFTVDCTSQILSIPTLGWGGKALMVLLMLGFGLVGFQLYRRSA